MCASNNNVKPDVVDDPLVQTWLNEFSNPRTKRNYTYGIRAFFGAVDFSPAEFIALSQREIKQAVLWYQNKGGVMKYFNWCGLFVRKTFIDQSPAYAKKHC